MPEPSHKPQRLLDITEGPVISLESASCPGSMGGRLWHFTPQLQQKLVLNRPNLLLCRYCGFVWSQDEEENRRKTLAEALERREYNS